MRLKVKNIEIGHKQIKVFHKDEGVSRLNVFIIVRLPIRQQKIRPENVRI
jgi:hypothetical protein